MSLDSPVLQAPDRRRGDWVLGALFVIVVGLVSLAVSLGLAVAFQPLLEAVGAFVAGRYWPAWILAVVSFLFFDVLRFALFWGAISLVGRPHRGRFIRYFLGFPVVAFALFCPSRGRTRRPDSLRPPLRCTRPSGSWLSVFS